MISTGIILVKTKFTTNLVWCSMKQFLRNTCKPHNLEQLKAGIEESHTTSMMSLHQPLAQGYS